jgi:outer membrane protein TolC
MRNLATTIIGLAVLLAPAGPARAQDAAAAGDGAATLQLTLDAAVQRAIEHNPELAIVRLGTEVESTRVGEARTAYTPELLTTVARSNLGVPPTNYLLGNQGTVTRDLFSQAGVRQRVPWGNGTWSLSWDAARTTSNSPLNSFEPAVQSGLQVAFSQPLVRDRKIDPSAQQLIIAKRNQQSSELQFRESAVQTVATVKQAYWTFKALRANVTVQQRSLALAEQLAKENGVRVQLGQAPPLDLVQVQSEVAERRGALIRAEAAAADGEDVLRRLIMDPSDGSFWNVHLDPVDEPTRRASLPDVEAVVAKAMNERYDVARAMNDVSIAASNVEFLSNQKLPDVRLETSYRGNGLGGSQLLRTGTFPGTIVGRTGTGFGDVLGQVLSQDYPTWSVGVTVSYPLGRGYEEVSAVRAGIERQQAAQRVASLKLDAAAAIRQAARQVRSTAEREEAARAGAGFAEQRSTSEQRRYQVGLSTTFLVTQAQRDLLQAQVNLLQATLDYQSALVGFEALQLAPAAAPGARLALQGSDVVLVPPPTTPRGLFRPGTNGAF